MLLYVFYALLSFLSVYSAAYYFSVFLFFFLRKKQNLPEEVIFSGKPEDVTVMIPSRNEGEGPLHTIHSVLNQDYAGRIEIYFILKDETDSSIPFLEKEFTYFNFTEKNFHEVYKNKNRKVNVLFAGDDSKSKKLNACVNQIQSFYSAVLDADHQAEKRWISSSVYLLTQNQQRIIQSIRRPIHAPGFFSFWDSVHQHTGYELFSSVFSALGLTVFFTGSTAVMETDLLKTYPMTDCITEDTDFSYTLMGKGIRISRNPFYGSMEEVSPDFFSFAARRRRWAGGHTQTFFSHLRQMLVSRVKLREKVQFIFHGTHYLTAVFVFLLHLLTGILLLPHLRQESILTAFLFSLAFALSISVSQKTPEWKSRVLETMTLTAWFFPGIIIAMNITEAFLSLDFRRIYLNLPIAYEAAAAGIIIFLSPVVLNLAGFAGFRQFGFFRYLFLIATYPFVLYLDISGILLGLSDVITGNQRWRFVSRSGMLNLLPKDDADGFAGGDKTKKLKFKPPDLSAGGAHPGMTKYYRFTAAALMILFFGFVYISVSGTVPLESRNCLMMEHDSHPWILPSEKGNSYCIKKSDSRGKLYSRRSGSFIEEKTDSFHVFDETYWDRLDTTFPCNLSSFNPENAVILPPGMRFILEQKPFNGKEFSSGSIATKNNNESLHLYGRYETVLKAAKLPGAITSFFLYRFDPWQEIDMEFLGKDTTRVLINVFYNPGEEGDRYNYGYFGTPVSVDLGFDASEEFHAYAVEWDRDEIRWFADGNLIHRRVSGEPTPIPHLPMRFHASLWPICSEALAGKFNPALLPSQAEIKSISIFRWRESFFAKFRGYLPLEDGGGWREKAEWIQPAK